MSMAAHTRAFHLAIIRVLKQFLAAWEEWVKAHP